MYTQEKLSSAAEVEHQIYVREVGKCSPFTFIESRVSSLPAFLAVITVSTPALHGELPIRSSYGMHYK